MSAAIAEFSKEVSTKLQAKHGESVANEFMGIYHKLNGSHFKNFAWLKELDFVELQQEADSKEQRKRNLEAIVAGLELFKDLRAYGKIHQHYSKLLSMANMPPVVELCLPEPVPVEGGHNGTAPSLIVEEIKAEPACEVKPKRVRKPKIKIDTTLKNEVITPDAVLPDIVEDICGTKVAVDKKMKRTTKKKSPAESPSATNQSSSTLTKNYVIKVTPNMTEKQKEAVLTRVKKMLSKA
jgi:hypothetical protein